MKHVLNIGSVNIDHVYQVGRLVRSGETLASADYQRFAGGKGYNQSIALARAGLRVSHAGRIGRDGLWLREKLATEGVDVAALQTTTAPTGHAVIQVTSRGENAILIHGGANRMLDAECITQVFDRAGDVDLILLQNETSAVAQALSIARERGLPVAFNPAPMTADIERLPLDSLTVLIVNEIEAAGLLETGEADPQALCDKLAKRYPNTLCVLTAGERGAWAVRGNQRWHDPGRPVQAVDTTAAGDTFIGFFLAEWLASGSAPDALAMGNRAASISVTRPGAADSIPLREQLPDRR